MSGIHVLRLGLNGGGIKDQGVLSSPGVDAASGSVNKPARAEINLYINRDGTASLTAGGLAPNGAVVITGYTGALVDWITPNTSTIGDNWWVRATLTDAAYDDGETLLFISNPMASFAQLNVDRRLQFYLNADFSEFETGYTADRSGTVTIDFIYGGPTGYEQRWGTINYTLSVAST